MRIAMLLVFLAGCSPMAVTYDTTVPIRGGLITTQVTFYDTDSEVARACAIRGVAGSRYGCASIGGKDPFVIVRRPVNFNDWPALCVLGHEIGHNLGGAHE